MSKVLLHLSTDFNEDTNYVVTLDIRNMLDRKVTIHWKQGNDIRTKNVDAKGQQFINVNVVKKFYPDPLNVSAFYNDTGKSIKLRGSKELSVMLYRKAFVERIDIGKCFSY